MTCLLKRRLPLLALSGFSLVGIALAEDGPPKLDVGATCKSSASAEVRIGQSAGSDGCERSEREAETDLKKRWSEFPSVAKKQCSEQWQAGGFPSYVEILTCLELASGTAPGRSGQAPKEKGDSSLVEPSPNQRTNPIDVLHDKNED